MARRGRPPKPKKTKPNKIRMPTHEELVQAEMDKKGGPNRVIAERRVLFRPLVQADSKRRLDGRNGEIDSEICDAIGQLCALGLFDGHGHDPIEMRDKGRFWGGHYVKLMKPLATKVGSAERVSRGPSSGALTGADMLFDKMDDTLPGYERGVLLSLIVDPLIGHHETVPWAQSLIDEALIERGRIPQAMRFPDESDRAFLAAAIRGLCVLVDGALPARWAA